MGKSDNLRMKYGVTVNEFVREMPPNKYQV